jgi:hypothetical protein
LQARACAVNGNLIVRLIIRSKVHLVPNYVSVRTEETQGSDAALQPIV